MFAIWNEKLVVETIKIRWRRAIDRSQIGCSMKRVVKFNNFYSKRCVVKNFRIVMQ